MTGPGSRPNVLRGAATGESIKPKLSHCRQTLKQIQPGGTLLRSREVPENIVRVNLWTLRELTSCVFLGG